ncbi:MAG: hydrogenase formation protein HypD, partial [Gammaproteobacteria bacterium]|nr:hydrogenase formation protein HypD [Gammaproteobacteria bacterium]
IKVLSDEIFFERRRAGNNKPIRLMEFCGGHTHTIFRYGIEQLLPNEIEMVHGPGCPVCVLPMAAVDICVALAKQPNVILTTFGDAMRVPGTEMSLQTAKSQGADIRMVYSPLDALSLAKKNPDKEIIFFALGFETTMPSTAITVQAAQQQGISNFSLFCNHITTLPTIQTVLDDPDMRLDGMVAPGHVSMVVGKEPFDTLLARYQLPIVITGFEPIDILQSIKLLLEQLAASQAKVINQYRRVVKNTGNEQARNAMQAVFKTATDQEWRGLGEIPNSGVLIRSAYQDYDALHKFNLPKLTPTNKDPLHCAQVIKGQIKPCDCPNYGVSCTPEQPLGALMVSSEGACAAYQKYSISS